MSLNISTSMQQLDSGKKEVRTKPLYNFREIRLNSKRWYASGDKGRLDSQGYLMLSGRLKRFVKIGGEMVSLGGLEEEILRIAYEKCWITAQEEGPALAISAQEKNVDKPIIILFTIFSITKEEINAALKECGVGRIVKIAQINVLEQIPLTGAGKTNYRLLDEMWDRNERE